jgi:hypothetical protein
MTETKIGHKDINLDQLIEQAVAKGAKKALAEMGLDDASASRDLRDLRDLLTSWRRIQRDAGRSLITFGVRALLIFMVLMAGFVITSGMGQ